MSLPLAVLFVIIGASWFGGWCLRAVKGQSREEAAYSDGWEEGRKDLHEMPTAEFVRVISTRARHGTNTMYTNHHCRCDECRSAHAEVQRKWYAQRKAADPSWSPHRRVVQLTLF